MDGPQAKFGNNILDTIFNHKQAACQNQSFHRKIDTAPLDGYWIQYKFITALPVSVHQRVFHKLETAPGMGAISHQDAATRTKSDVENSRLKQGTMVVQLIGAPVTISSSNTAAISANPGGRLVRKTAVELVLAELRTRILSGAIAPGSPLRQEALADELGVSRIPLREAIRLLSSEGLVDVLPHKGAYVSMLSKEDVQEFFDLRLRLEPWLLHEAIERISQAELARAEKIVAAMDVAAADAWGTLNWQLHELLYSAAARPAALAIVRALHEKSERYFRFQVVNAPIKEQAHGEHLLLIELCRHRQADKAQAVLEKHIADAAEQILAIVSRLLDDSSPKKTA